MNSEVFDRSSEDIGSSLQKEVKRELENAAGDNSDMLLLSGGLDSSSLAAVSPVNDAVTVVFEEKGSDAFYAERVAEELNLDWEVLSLDTKDVVSILGEMIEQRESFDPGMFNDVPVFKSMEYAVEQGCEEVMTGDAGDYVFLGYSFLWDMNNPDQYVKDTLDHLTFSSEEIGNSMGLDVNQPYLDEDFVDFATSIEPDLKIKEVAGSPAGDVSVDDLDENRWGKWILREAMEEELASEIVYRPKTDLEYGSGMQRFRERLGEFYTQSDVRQAESEYDVELIDESHLFLFELFLDQFDGLPKSQGNEYCDNCSYEKPPERSHCGTCGIYEEA
jgi:asparagine synthase (glutamine-hydrolysing)